jgi:hypothetical protein
VITALSLEAKGNNPTLNAAVTVKLCISTVILTPLTEELELPILHTAMYNGVE